MGFRTCVLGLLVVSLGGLVDYVTAESRFPLQPVAVEGDTAPGIAGAVFRWGGPGYGQTLGSPVIDHEGRVGFTAAIDGPGITHTNPDTGALGNDTGVWYGTPSNLQLMARAGSAAPGLPANVRFHDFPRNGARLNTRAGRLDFRAVLRGTGVSSTNDGSMWQYAGGETALLAREGSPVPGGPPGMSVRALAASSPPVLSSTGQTGLWLVFREDASGQERSGWWTGDATGGTSIVSGQTPPGFPSGVEYSMLTAASLNDAGQTMFAALIQDGDNDGLNNETLWLGPPDSPQLLLRTGGPAPGFDPEHLLANIHPNHLPAFNNAGETAFWGRTTVELGELERDAIWRGNPDAFSVVAKRGDVAPGADGSTLWFLGPPIMNGAGDVIFEGQLWDDSKRYIVGRGIWRHDDAGLAPLVISGTEAPGTEPGVVFGDHPFYPTSNSVGQVIFGAGLSGPGVTSDNEYGIWASLPDGDLELVLRAGDLLEVAPGDVRMVDGFAYNQVSGGQDGWPMSLNDRGEFAFMVRFTDGTDGIFIARIPEPTAGAAATLLLVLAGRRRWRRWPSARV